MATATLTSTPTVLNNADTTTGWNGDSFSVEPDIKVQGTNSVACTQTDNGANDIYVTGFTGFSINTTDVHFRLWFNITFIGNLAATNAIQVWCTDGTNTAYWTWTEGANYAGGWAQAIIHTGLTPTSGTKPTGTLTQIGMRFNTASKPRNVPANSWFDYWTYGDGYTVTGGTSGDPITWDEIAAADTDVTNTAYNIVTKLGGVVFIRGDIQIGDGTSTTYFEPTGQIAVFPTEQVSTSLYSLSFVDSASNLTNIAISGGAWASESATYRFAFDASDTDINAFSIEGIQFAKAGLMDFAAGASVTNTVFDNCLQIVPSTATFQNNTMSNSVDTGGAVLYPNTETNIKNLIFINCDNGVEMDTTTTASGTKTTFGFDNLQFDDEVGNFDVNNTSGVTLSVNKNNGSNPNSYTGTLVNFLGTSVTLTITALDIDTKAAIENVAVTVWAADGTGDLPYQDTVTITQTAGTATVSHTAHGLSTGDKVEIKGANENNYNRIKTITVTTANAYTYPIDSGTASPATGTITSTGVIINALTNASGVVSDTRSYSIDQPWTGKAQKGTSLPVYVDSPIQGIIDKDTGQSVTALMIPD